MDPKDVSADVVDFEEAVAWFREKTPVSDADWERMDESARAQAFRVAGVAQLDVAADVCRAIDEALASGLPLGEFQKLVGPELEEAWGGTVANPGWRIETIFRTNVQSAYSAGRYAQMTTPDMIRDRPYWTCEVIEDGRECDVCEPCDGIVLPADDPWWRSHHVPLHFNCRCETHSLSADEAHKRGIDAAGPAVQPDEGFGAPPRLGEWAPRGSDYPSELWNELQAKELWKELKAKGEPAPPSERTIPTIAKVSKQRGLRDVPAVTEVIDDPRVTHALERVPVTELAFRKHALAGKRKVAGSYDPARRRIEVTVERTPESFGKTFEPGKSWSVSTCGKDAANAAERTFVHELAHHLHMSAGGAPVERAVHDGFAQRKPITRYANVDPYEYFAESFAAYRYHKDELRAHDPAGFAMVERVLHLLGER